MKAILIVPCLILSLNAWAGELPAEASAVLLETQGKSVAAPVVEAVKADAPPATATAAAPASEVALVVPVAKTAASEKLPENEIPLNFDSKKAGASAADSPWMRLIFGAAVAGLMAAGAWFLTRRMAKPGQRKSGPQIKVLNQHWLGPKKSLAIIHVAGESILIGVTEQNISLIKSLSLIDDEVPVEVPTHFAKSLQNAEAAAPIEAEDEVEDFTISGLNQIKDVVGRRLRNMRTLG